MFVEIKKKKIKVRLRKKKFTLSLPGRQIQNIDDIKNLDGLYDLQKLNLFNNSIVNIKGFDKLINLEKLNLRQNKITEIKGLENLTKLEELDLRSNLIEKIENLEHLSNLNTLLLQGNACYREFIRKFVGDRKMQNDIIDQGVTLYARSSLERKNEFEKNGLITIEEVPEYHGMKMFDIAEKVEKYLEDIYLNEKYIYYPIEATPLIERLGDFMKKEDVIYSTFCNFRYFNTVSNKRGNWQSHLLISKNGVAYFLPASSEIVYQEWKYVNSYHPKINYLSPNKEITETVEALINFIIPRIKRIQTQLFEYNLIRNNQLESKELFENRKGEFSLFCRLLWVRDLFKNPPLEFFEYQNLLKFLNRRLIRKIMENLLRDTIHLID